MRIKENGQVIIILAVLLVVVLTILAVIIDGVRMMVEQQEIKRAADAAGKAGLIIVGDHMITQVVAAQIAAASNTFAETPIGSTPGLMLTSSPAEDDFFSWINDDHRKTLVAPPMQTLVATHVLGSAEENDHGLSNPVITEIEITYPENYLAGEQNIQIKVRIDRVMVFLFGSLFNFDEGVLSGNTKQNIPQR